MNKNAIIKFLDNYLLNFCRNNPGYQIFRIGSSLFESQIPIHDIDYFLVNENSDINYIDRIQNLKSNFSGKDFLQSAVYTNDSIIEASLANAAIEIQKEFGVIIKPVFGFGPIVMPTDKEILVLHLAGPMNVQSCNYFFSQFPLFHFLWAKYNLQLGSRTFTDLITDPVKTEKDIAEEYTRIFTRASTIENPYIRRQCLKRLSLVELALAGHVNPFLASVKLVTDKTDEQILIELERFRPLTNFT